MASRVAKYGIEFNFFAVSGGRIDNPPHENQVYEIWRRYWVMYPFCFSFFSFRFGMGAIMKGNLS